MIFAKQRMRRRNGATQEVRTSHAAQCTRQRARRQDGVARRMNKEADAPEERRDARSVDVLCGTAHKAADAPEERCDAGNVDGQRVVSGDIDEDVRADMHVDALHQPKFYRGAAELTGATAVVASLHFAVLDLFMPVVTMTAARLPLIAVHAPGHYLISGPRPRMGWFDELAREGRLHVLFGSPRAVTGYRSVCLDMHILIKARAAILAARQRSRPRRGRRCDSWPERGSALAGSAARRLGA